MVERLQDRHVTVYAQDAQRAPLTDAVFAFSVEGTDYGTVENSTGRADITLPGAETRPLTATASYKGKSQTAKIAPDQTTYTFTFRSGASMGRISKAAVWALAALAFLIVAAILAVAFIHPRGPDQPAGPVLDPDERRARSIQQLCAAGHVVENESALNAELTTAVKKARAGAAVTSEDVGAIVPKIASDPTGVTFYQTYTKCVADSLARLTPQAPAPAPPPAETKSASDGPAPIPGGTRGWSYYEEENGKPTQDGVLMPAGAQPAPAYAKIAKGLVLKSRRGFKIRRKPGGSEEIVAQPGAARCVVVLDPPTKPVGVSEATSGGWLEVAITRCP